MFDSYHGDALIWFKVTLTFTTRSFPVPQWAPKCAPVPVHRWPSHLCHGLGSHLLPLHLLLHGCPGMNLYDLSLMGVHVFTLLKMNNTVHSWQGKLMRQQGRAYFKSKWNLLELAIIILSWSAFSVFIKRTVLGKRDIEYYQNNKDQ